jgi:translation elongation factor EF-G
LKEKLEELRNWRCLEIKENLEEFVNSIIKEMVEKNFNLKDFIERILDSFVKKYGAEKIILILIDKLNSLIEKNPSFLKNLDFPLENLEENDYARLHYLLD